jgi:hypothetical protein
MKKTDLLYFFIGRDTNVEAHIFSTIVAAFIQFVFEDDNLTIHASWFLKINTGRSFLDILLAWYNHRISPDDIHNLKKRTKMVAFASSSRNLEFAFRLFVLYMW